LAALGGAAAGGEKQKLPVPALPFYKRKAPPLPAPEGRVVEVRTVAGLMKACDRPTAGTTVTLADGRYNLTRLIRLRGMKNVTIRGKSGDRNKVILDGSGVKKGELIWFESCDRVTVADLTLQNARVHGFTVKGESGAQRVRIYNCRVRNCWERYVKGTAPYDKERRPAKAPDEAVLKVRPAGGRVEWCLFEQDHPKKQKDWTGGNYIGGIDMMWLKNWVISDNVFLGIRGRTGEGRGAIFIWNNSEDVLVERNLIAGCDTGIALGNPSGAKLHVIRGTVCNNFVVRGAYKAVELVRTRDCKVYNNTVWSKDAGWDRTFHLFQGTAGAEVFNNLVRGRLRVDGKGARLVAGNLTGDMAGFFRAPEKGDLHLAPKGAAAARGKGRAVPEGVTDFDGQPRAGRVDLGADQLDK